MDIKNGGELSKELLDKQLQDMLDSYPEVEELKEFDSFLVGDGSAELMSRVDKPRGRLNFQLSGIHSYKDLVNKPDIELYDNGLTDDLCEYAKDSCLGNGQYFDHYVEVKRRILSNYNFLEIKSKKLTGVAFKEIDLIVSSNEKYMVKYLTSSVGIDHGIIDSLAQLMSLKDLGFTECKFKCLDGCPLCSAFNGNIYSVFSLCDLFGSGRYLIHGNCLGEFIPVIRDRSKVNGLEIDNRSVFIGDVKVINAPTEYLVDLVELLPNSSLEEVHFINLRGKFKNLTSEVIVEDGGVLYVHNMYYGSYSPIDYLVEWLSSDNYEELSNSIIERKIVDGDIYYLDGRKVVDVDGVYFDVETMERVL